MPLAVDFPQVEIYIKPQDYLCTTASLTFMCLVPASPECDQQFRMVLRR